jgi:hypothetical protein
MKKIIINSSKIPDFNEKKQRPFIDFDLKRYNSKICDVCPECSFEWRNGHAKDCKNNLTIK